MTVHDDMSLHKEGLFFVMKTAYFDPASSKLCQTA